jgi:hypothetical protein
MSQEDPILVDYRGRVAIITLNVPKKLNALSGENYYKLARALLEVAEHDEVFITVLTGKGRFFSAYVSSTHPCAEEVQHANNNGCIEAQTYLSAQQPTPLPLTSANNGSRASSQTTCTLPTPYVSFLHHQPLQSQLTTNLVLHAPQNPRHSPQRPRSRPLRRPHLLL